MKMMRMSYVAVIAFVLTLWLTGCPRPKPPVSGIVGQVINQQTKKPVPNALVTLQRGQTTIAQMTTDEQGRFGFISIPSATYNLIVTAEGFVETSYGVTIMAGQRKAVTVPLQQEAPPSNLPIVDP